jgi:hypothetical protein
MCKVGSTGAGDVNSKVYKKETTLKLYKSARRCATAFLKKFLFVCGKRNAVVFVIFAVVIS